MTAEAGLHRARSGVRPTVARARRNRQRTRKHFLRARWRVRSGRARWEIAGDKSNTRVHVSAIVCALRNAQRGCARAMRV